MKKKSSRASKTSAALIADVLGFGSKDSPVKTGFALITTTVMLGLMLAFTSIMLNSAMSTRKVGNTFEQELSAEEISEAGVHKALYCLKASSGTNCGGTYGTNYVGESNVALDGGKFTTTVTGDSTTKTITATGVSPSGQTEMVKSDITTLPPTTSLILAAAVQAGSGGVSMANNVVVTGDQDTNNTESDSDIQSVGDITCGNNAEIKGNVAVTRSGGTVHDCKVTKNAYADVLTGDTISGDAYYLTDPADISGSTVSGTKHANSTTPVPTPFPNLNIAYWESLAAAGTVMGSGYSLGNNATATIGATKIVGDLTTSNNVTLTLTGPVWITGNVTLGNNTIIKLSPSYGTASGIMIVDGTVTINNNSDFQGSGTAGSVIILVSNSTADTDSSPAIQASNNVTGAVLYAPNGEVHTSNNAGVPAAIGLTVDMDNNTTINSSGLNVFNAPINIASSVVSSGWHIGTKTWREFK